MSVRPPSSKLESKKFKNKSFLVQVHLPRTRARRRSRSDGRGDERDDQPVGRGLGRADQRRRSVEASHFPGKDGHSRNFESSRDEGHPAGHRRGTQGETFQILLFVVPN